jgi:hypothetical protein
MDQDIDYYINRAKNYLFQSLSPPPSASFYLALRFACSDGNVNAVDQMLKDSRFDYTIRSENFIFYATMYERIEIINRLMQDPRIDPSTDNNFALKWARKFKHLDVVNRLLYDRRVRDKCKNIDDLNLIEYEPEEAVARISRCGYNEQNIDFKFEKEINALKQKYIEVGCVLLQEVGLLSEYVFIIISLLIDYTHEEIIAIMKEATPPKTN